LAAATDLPNCPLAVVPVVLVVLVVPAVLVVQVVLVGSAAPEE
jgi:hypothetical protein